MAAIIIQHLSRNKQVQSQASTDKTQISIGRSYSCDQRLDDPYVCEHHLSARANADGQIELEDAGTVNGLKVNGKRVDKAVVTASDTVTIGRSQIRLFSSASHTLPPALKLNPLAEKLEWLSYKSVLLFLALAMVALTAAETYFNSYTKVDVGDVLKNVLGVVLILCIFPLAMSLLSVLNKKESNLISQLSLIALVSILIVVVESIFGLLVFNFDNAVFMASVQTLLYWLLYGAVLWLSLYLAFHQSNRKRSAITALICLVFAAGIYVPDYFDDTRFVGQAQANIRIHSSSLLIVDPISTNNFISEAQDLFEQVDNSRETEED